MYCIVSIYAGDILYAHAGHSSLVEGNKYSFRRKLYEAYDVAYENSLYSQTGTDLYYNMSLINFDVNGDLINDEYREVTKVRSDYTVFDSQSIPVVFFESQADTANIPQNIHNKTKPCNLLFINFSLRKIKVSHKPWTFIISQNRKKTKRKKLSCSFRLNRPWKSNWFFGVYR